MKWIISILMNSLVLIVVSGLLKIIAPNAFYIANIPTAIVASIILSILNVFVKPFLVLITLPITLFTFGFFLIVINAFTLKIVEALLGNAFHIQGFGTAIVAAIFIAVLNMLIDSTVVSPFAKKNRK
ncbi:phage holin family protein [Ectobacillus polymachus]|uniref:phage holin family protein n=1 Tax=Ectobacillus polymachus TaxID=1508806 RepID=UPI003A86F065